MKKAIETQESQMTAQVMADVEESKVAKYGKVELWALCYKGFKAGLSEDEVIGLLNCLR